MKRLIVVALVRDIGAGNAMALTLREIERYGHRVFLFADKDGQAKNHLRMAFEVVGGEFLLRQRVKEIKPDIIATGLSSTRGLEDVLDALARERDVPLAHLEDYWGAHVRSPISADSVITVDQTAARLVHKAWPRSRVIVAGFAGITPVVPPTSLVKTIATLQKEGFVLVYPDGGPESETALPCLVRSIQLTSAKVILIPKIHPKLASSPHPSGAGSWKNWCDEQMLPLKSCGQLVELSAATDEVVMVADAVASAYSSLLMRSATQGKLALTLWNEAVKTLLKKETGLDQTPLMLAGGYPVLCRPQPLDGLIHKIWRKYELSAFDASVAAEAVLELAA